MSTAARSASSSASSRSTHRRSRRRCWPVAAARHAISASSTCCSAELPVWAEAANPLAELARIGRLGGISAEAFEACLQDESLADGILGNRLVGEQEHGVSSTPSFVVNGRLLTGALDIAQFEGIIEPLLAGATGAGAGPAAQPQATAPAPTPASSWPIWAIVAVVAAAALGPRRVAGHAPARARPPAA